MPHNFGSRAETTRGTHEQFFPLWAQHGPIMDGHGAKACAYKFNFRLAMKHSALEVGHKAHTQAE
eukprot:1162096-Pelagomonas_calceolata.AAC.4